MGGDLDVLIQPDGGDEVYLPGSRSRFTSIYRNPHKTTYIDPCCRVHGNGRRQIGQAIERVIEDVFAAQAACREIPSWKEP